MNSTDANASIYWLPTDVYSVANVALFMVSSMGSIALASGGGLAGVFAMLAAKAAKLEER